MSHQLGGGRVLVMVIAWLAVVALAVVLASIALSQSMQPAPRDICLVFSTTPSGNWHTLRIRFAVNKVTTFFNSTDSAAHTYDLRIEGPYYLEELQVGPPYDLRDYIVNLLGVNTPYMAPFTHEVQEDAVYNPMLVTAIQQMMFSMEHLPSTHYGLNFEIVDTGETFSVEPPNLKFC